MNKRKSVKVPLIISLIGLALVVLFVFIFPGPPKTRGEATTMMIANGISSSLFVIFSIITIVRAIANSVAKKRISSSDDTRS